MSEFDEELAIGIVLDLRRRQWEGRNLLDLVKDQLIAFASDLGLASGLYVAHRDNQRMPRKQGESVADISNWQEIIGSEIGESLRQATHMIGAQPDNGKWVVLISDRYSEKMKYRYRKPFLLNQSKNYGCRFLYLMLECDELSEKPDECEEIRISCPSEIRDVLKKEILR